MSDVDRVRTPPIVVSKKLRDSVNKAVERKGWTFSKVFRILLEAFARGDERLYRVIEDELQKK